VGEVNGDYRASSSVQNESVARSKEKNQPCPIEPTLGRKREKSENAQVANNLRCQKRNRSSPWP